MEGNGQPKVNVLMPVTRTAMTTPMATIHAAQKGTSPESSGNVSLMVQIFTHPQLSLRRQEPSGLGYCLLNESRQDSQVAW